MNIDYIIIQAGGKGTRLEHMTKNKPKALVSIQNLPMIFHAFKQFPDKHFVIIGDYKFDVLEKYLKAFATVDYKLVNANGKSGTCAGIADALKLVPDNKAFLLMWSDLVLSKQFNLDNLEDFNYVGLSTDFVCRWSFQKGKFLETPSDKFGVAGLFVFRNKELISDVMEEGEFVRWLSSKNIDLKTLSLKGCNEYGLLKVVNGLEKMKCRPFNRLIIEEDTITKEGIDSQGLELAKRERAWYKQVMDKNFPSLPYIYSLEPLKMQKVHGDNIYVYDKLSYEEKTKILIQIVNCLKDLHKLGKIPADKESYDDAYIDKTLKRLEKVKELVPFAKDEYVVINGIKCKNFFYVIDEVKQKISSYYPKEFAFIHGDTTFSNILLDNDGTPVLIDPRGYFGKIDFYGDVAYDWAKLYYSLVGNYDQFNLKNFKLVINDDNVELKIKSSNWEDMADLYFELIKEDVKVEQLNLIHAILWLSLTTYAWDDYDSICGAFYNGLLWLNKCI